MADRPFPTERVSALLVRVPAYGRLAWRLTRDPAVSRSRRIAVLAAGAYLVSPIDLVPGLIPVVGQLDDVAIVLAALRFALGGLDDDARRVHLDAVGVAEKDLSDDLDTVGVTAAWLARAGGRVGARAIRQGSRGALAMSRAIGRSASRTSRGRPGC